MTLADKLALGWDAHRALTKELEKYINEHGDNNRYVVHQKELLAAIADLLNKEDPSGIIVIEELRNQQGHTKFYAKSWDKLYFYRDWFADRVNVDNSHLEDVDHANIRAFAKRYNI